MNWQTFWGIPDTNSGKGLNTKMNIQQPFSLENSNFVEIPSHLEVFNLELWHSLMFKAESKSRINGTPVRRGTTCSSNQPVPQINTPASPNPWRQRLASLKNTFMGSPRFHRRKMQGILIYLFEINNSTMKIALFSPSSIFWRCRKSGRFIFRVRMFTFYCYVEMCSIKYKIPCIQCI